MSKRWLCLLVSFTFFICSSVQVFAKADVNADGDDASDAGTAVTNIFIPDHPIQGVRVTVVDTLKGANTVKGSVNFLKNLGEESKRKAEGYSIYRLNSSKDWKANASGEWEAGMPAYVASDRVPDDDMDKTAYVEDEETWKRVASQLGMVYSEDASILLDPNPAENILNQKRYKLVFEPVSEVKFGGKKVSIIGTTAEQMHVFKDLGGADQKSYLKNLSTYMMRSVPNSAFTKKVDKDLSVSDGTKEKGMGQGGDRSGIVLNGDGSQSIGGLGVGIISFGGADSSSTDTDKDKDKKGNEGNPNGGGQPIPPPPSTSKSIYTIKADYLNLNDTDNQENKFHGAPENGQWVKVDALATYGSTNNHEVKEWKYSADSFDSSNSTGSQHFMFSSNRGQTTPATVLRWASTMKNSVKPTNLSEIKEATHTKETQSDVINTISVLGFNSNKSTGVYQYQAPSGMSCGKCNTIWKTEEEALDCCPGGEEAALVNQLKGEPPLIVLSHADATRAYDGTSYNADATYFEKAHKGNINSMIQKPKMQGNILTQKFTLKPQTMTVYPYYKMNYFKDGLIPATENAWMCATGAREITYYPEVTITVKSTEPNITAPWSRDKVDFDFNNGSTKILKAGNALSLEQKRFEEYRR